MTEKSRWLYETAQRVIPGGVNSPVRAFKSVGGSPRFIQSAFGAYLIDADGNRLIDYIGSWGPMILGHQHSHVLASIQSALTEGVSFGAPNAREVELAMMVTKLTGMEKVRFVSSGTEATMSALRLARAVTGRDYILKFRGNYHGHADGLLVEAGSGLMTNEQKLQARSAPSSAGVPQAYAGLTLVADYNDPEGLAQLLRDRGNTLAAIIFEPVVGNAGVLIPTAEFIDVLHSAKEQGILLIADEVMTGFRLSPGGATERLGLKPDIITWGKIIGGGLPVGAYGASAEIMDFVSPMGPVYQAGTLSGNPLAMAAGIGTLQTLRDNPEIYEKIEDYTERLEQGLLLAAAQAGISVCVNRIGSMLTMFFTEGPVQTYQDAVRSDTRLFAQWFHEMLNRGVYWAPSQFESIFVSAAHNERTLEHTLQAAASAFLTIKSQSQG
ncbi:glutamate-1-semialdehyde 2,1-aminomutase [Deinococcus cellulosilyticus]|uniref:Glutamate-1-semialdehyde 2,1-aminomutase n=1 Tax=Deinococcus cellulosilyticus (strain DSM 18568 / NBRC 106333 / KACC 11606 / 5516J-15) TaxID=1223518 RepID=A0A511N8P6_DEIC1|nr:glutamate-1-semialdehyde 2,1-aminomutase [Deinococcus cellulosilyticus]GEM48907.1 glutamate-1-semialdehyde 2,1-aminomutase [Deinococcus cellulosilyticus NBRC 106333 = KACC 11606]